MPKRQIASETAPPKPDQPLASTLVPGEPGTTVVGSASSDVPPPPPPPSASSGTPPPPPSSSASSGTPPPLPPPSASSGTPPPPPSSSASSGTPPPPPPREYQSSIIKNSNPTNPPPDNDPEPTPKPPGPTPTPTPAPTPNTPGEECTTKQEFSTCTTQFFIITSVFPDQDSSTTSTSTSTNCHTITACTGVATTIAKTTETVTTIESFCEKGNCGGSACPAKQNRAALPTPAPISGGLTISDEISEEQNVTLVQRAFPGSGTGDWSDFYDDVLGRKETIILDNWTEFIPTHQAAVHFQPWGVTPVNVVTEGLYGCAALFCASHLGAAVAHFWENPSLMDKESWEKDMLYPIQELLGHKFALYNFGLDPVCHLMAGARKSIGDNGPEEQETLTQPWNGAILRAEAVEAIHEKLKKVLPDATVKDPFIYARQTKKDLHFVGGYGKGAVLFEPNTGTGNAVVKVYNQGVEVQKMEWLYQELQIWENVLDACEDVKTPVRSNMVVDLGSENTSVGEDLPFPLMDKNKNRVLEECVFKGGPYGRWEDGAEAGKLVCKGRTIRCTRPLGDAPGKSCRTDNPPDCGKLGEK
ncbi:hypothetical protein BDV95DRAFT_621641 [Massariosphaeria phaeospora]|uniref:Uncharacterized protein n=1 Tax=Massariosphaeria phaeospora TaxID=100035 RepID=A0A7C8I1A4_9PLEO|nr:hypothetical protein BDV95DRAFT_621641 [Massariosphaeria phaeospora]